MQIVGHVKGNKTVINKPKFKEKHFDFFKRYFKGEYFIKDAGIIKSNIHITPAVTELPPLSLSMVEIFIKAYEYEFGEW